MRSQPINGSSNARMKQVQPLSLPIVWSVLIVSFACFIAALGWPRPAAAAVSFIQAAGNSNGYPPASNQVSVSPAATTGAGDLMIVSVAWGDQSSTVSAVTDSAGNSYTRATGAIWWG